MNELCMSDGNAMLLASNSTSRQLSCMVSGSYAKEFSENILAPVEHEASFKPEKSQHLCNMDLKSVHLNCVI